MEPYRFTTQENQFTGECLPCTKAKFYTTANSASVNNTITTRQAIEKAIDEGQPLNNWLSCANFRNFCQKQASRPRAGEAFAALAVEQKLQQWTNSQKMWLPCFVFAVKEFAAIPKTDNPNFPWKVRLAHVTSSGHGLRLVCEANPDVGNIADNQIELGRELGLLGQLGSTGKPICDDSCIDASRISYAPRMCDIYYIDEDNLFNP